MSRVRYASVMHMTRSVTKPTETSNENLNSRPNTTSCLKHGIDFELLGANGHRVSGNRAVQDPTKAREEIIRTHQSSRKRRPLD